MVKKLLSFIISLTLLSALLASCNQGSTSGGVTDGEGNQQGTVGSDGSPSVIYGKDTELNIVINTDIDATALNGLYSALSGKINNAIYVVEDSAEELEHELVIGPSERAVSVEAYRRLERMRLEIDQEMSEAQRFLIYSDGSSVAIAYDEAEEACAEITALNYFTEEYVRDELILPRGTHHKEVVEIDDFYQALDDKQLEEEWLLLEEKSTPEIAEAMKELYTLYSDGIVSWSANLYDPETGGWYYSNSARDTEGYLPDIESTAQTIGIIISSGMIRKFDNDISEALPEGMGDKIAAWVKGLQDKNGYFYHPQWPRSFSDTKTSRLARDLGNAVGVLSYFGYKPTYDTPDGDTGDGMIISDGALVPLRTESTASAVSKVLAANSTAVIQGHLENKESFLAYLEELDVKNNSYSVGNTLTAIFGQIEHRDVLLAQAGADYSLVEILIDHLNENQNPKNGTWDHRSPSDPNYDPYYANNGFMKVSGVYNKAGVPIPNVDKAIMLAIECISRDEKPGAATDIYNTWFSIGRGLNNLKNYGGSAGEVLEAEILLYLRSVAPDAIRATKEKTRTFLRDDGSFSYTEKYSSHNSQGCPVALPESMEGDVNSVHLCCTDLLNHMYSALRLSDYQVSVLTYNDWRHYLDILNKQGPVMKDPEPTEFEPFDFDYATPDTTPEELSVETRSADRTLVFPDPREGANGNVIRLVGIAGTSDSIDIPSMNRSTAFSTYNFEGEFCLVSSDGSQPIQFTMGDCYYFSLRVLNGNEVAIVESTSAKASASKDTLLYRGIKLGEWFSLRVEYFKGSDEACRIKFYVNGELIAVTNNYFDEDGSRFINGYDQPGETFDGVNVWGLKSCTYELLMDNLLSYKSNTPYKAEKDPEKQPPINCDAPVGSGDGFDGYIPVYEGSYYGSSLIEGTRYDYSVPMLMDSLYGKALDDDSNSVTSLVKVAQVSSGKLAISVIGNWGTLALKNKADAAIPEGNAQIFETDFTFHGGSQAEDDRDSGIAFIGFFGSHATTDNNKMSRYTVIRMKRGVEDAVYIGKAELKRGVTYNLRFELYEDEITLFVNGERYEIGGVAGKEGDPSTYEAFGFYFRKNFTEPLSITLDNTFMGYFEPTPPPPPPPFSVPSLPDGVETLYGDEENVGTRYGFDEEYGSDLLFTQVDASKDKTRAEAVTVKDGYLIVENTANWQGFVISSGINESSVKGTRYLFETEFTWLGGAQTAGKAANGAAFVGLVPKNGAYSNNNYHLSGGYIKFIEGDTSKMLFYDYELLKDVTYAIRMEFTVGTGLKVFVNNVEVATVANTAVNTSGLGGFSVYIRRDFTEKLSFAMNNVFFAQLPPEGGETEEKPDFEPTEYTDTYYNNVRVSGTRYGFTEDTLTKFEEGSNESGALAFDYDEGTVGYINNGSAEFSVRNESLYLSSTAWTGFSLANKGEKNASEGDRLVMEFNLVFRGGTSAKPDDLKALYLGFIGNGTDTVYSNTDKNMINCATLDFVADSTEKAMLLGATLTKNKQYSVRIEYTVGSGKTDMYLDGVLAGSYELSNYCGADNLLTGFAFYFKGSRIDANLELYIDNVFIGILPEKTV